MLNSSIAPPEKPNYVNFATMKRRLIIYIIILASVALIGFVYIQVYWIKNAISIKESAFRRSVNDAISNTITKLSEIEKVNIYKKTMKYYEQGSLIYSSIDSINDLLLSQAQAPPNKINQDTIIDNKNNLVKSKYNAHIDTLSQFQINELEKHFHGLIKHSVEFEDLVDDMFDFGFYKAVEDRIDESVLDSLLAFEFSKKGINTSYEYGVYCPARNLMVYQKTGDYLTELLKDSFGFLLFPDDVNLNPSYLVIYFPNETTFLLVQMWGLLMISVILILIIIFTFFLTINTIIKQKKLSEMKNDFINNMTHEFKTPVSTISLACEALSDKELKKSEELYQNYINIISEENNRLGNMAEKILQSAILEKDHVSLKFEIIDLHTILKEVIKNISMQVEIKDGKINTDLKAVSSKINGDKVHLSNVFINLLDNANKYSQSKPEITVETENSRESIIISIKDKGRGISKADQKKIFDKLYRVHTGDLHDIKGFGLGLTYVKVIVEEHRGKVSLESEPGQGTTFFVTLPLSF